MGIKLKNLVNLGRFKNADTGQAVNLKQGTGKYDGQTYYFYLRSGYRVFIANEDYQHTWILAQNT